MAERRSIVPRLAIGALQFIASYIVFVLVTATVEFLILQVGKRTSLLPGDWFLSADLPAAASLITMTAGLAPAALAGGYICGLVAPRLRNWVAVTPLIVLMGAYLSSLPLSSDHLAAHDLVGASALLAIPSGIAGSWLSVRRRRSDAQTDNIAHVPAADGGNKS